VGEFVVLNNRPKELLVKKRRVAECVTVFVL
jgi:hypothetical protein